MELLLVRHGLPVRVDHAPDGRADPGLAREGHEQARKLAAWLADDPLDAVWSSPLRRARETAAPVAEAHGVPVQVDDDLAEWDRQASFYVPLEELRAEGDPRYRALTEGRWAEEWDIDVAAFQRRVVGAVERVVAAHPGERAVLVCHGGVINAYLAWVLGLPSERLLFFEPVYAGISRVAASRTGARMILTVNEGPHLRAGQDLPLSSTG
jgi:broad specificity phosphatase PhoE